MCFCFCNGALHNDFDRTLYWTILALEFPHSRASCRSLYGTHDCRVARSSMSEEECVANVTAAIQVPCCSWQLHRALAQTGPAGVAHLLM